MMISASEFDSRIKYLQGNLSSHGLDAVIITEESSIYYLTGLTYKSLERLFLLVVKPERIVFIVPKMEVAHLKHVMNVDEVVYYEEYPAKEGARWQDLMLDNLKSCHAIGIEEKAPFEIPAFINREKSKAVLCSLLDEQRYVKSGKEIALIKRASEYCNKTIQKLNTSCYFGMTELEVLGIGKDILRRIIIETDFDYLSSDVLVAVWPSRIAHQPHGIPKINDRLIKGTHISLAFLRVNGYAAELERTFFTAPPTKQERDLFNLMLEARRQSFAKLKAGMTGEEIDKTAKEVFVKAGLGENIMHRTGHGIGLGNHEGPYLAEGDVTVLKENMVVSIEPGIYIEGVGGFRHSDTVRITKNGYEILTHCADGIDDLVFNKLKLYSRIKGFFARKMYGV